ncbi:hypothetical protein FRC11_000131 [Ceratobasidium sp. 423]|nr:hypothetical protein FRC11_000131 [Ceratobasidium sp. 423]
MVPLPTRTLTLPPETNDSHVARHNHVTRQISRVSSRSIGSPIDPAARLPVEFRTLSLHVDETARQEAAEKRKGTAKELSDLTFHTQTEEEILNLFSVSPTIGLDSTQAQRRLVTNGPNALSPPPSRTWRKVLEWIFGGFGSLLLAASIVCFIAWKPLGEPNPAPANLALAVVLLIVLLLNALFNMWQDISTTRTLASLTSLLPSAVTVLRDGQPTVTQASQLVTGDIVMLGTGVRVPADMRILKSEGLMVDRGVLTGESEPIPATTHYTDENFLETRNIALQGTYCVSGSGMGIVVQVGDGTVFGRIARLSTGPNTNGKNSLTAGLTTLQREILRFVLIIAGLRRDYPDYINIPTLLIDVVSVMVAFIPEGLPVAITMSLAKVAHTLSKKKVLCKSLSIVETLGSVNVLCSDKTGTLTQNKMSVQDVAVFDTEYTVMEFHDAANREGNSNLHQMGAVAAICNSANFASGTEDEPTNVRKALGDATDSAILRFAHTMRPIETARSTWEDVFKLNFSSKTKFMLKFSKLVDLSSGSLPAPLVPSDDFNPHTDYLLTVKGAPDVLYPRCTSIMSPVDGQVFDLTPERLAQITEIQNRWAARGRRVLMLGRRIVRGSELKGPISDETIAKVNWNLTIIGLVGLIDPLKEDIIETVRVCRGAGIRFFMVTGDHPATAVAIAAQAGIVSGNPDAIHRLSNLDSSLDEKSIPQYDPDAKDHNPFTPDSNTDPEKSGSALASAGMKSIVITGSDLMTITSSQMEQLCQYDEIVFARTSPEQKLRIVHEFQRRGGVVAMTGDGGSTPPPSRLVYDNLKKTVLYLLPAGSFSELMPIVLNILIGVPQMLSSLQMIIICVGTDVLPALSLALEKPEQGLLTRRPRNVKTDRLADWKLLLHAYGFIGVLESLCAMSMSFWYLQRNGVPFSDLVLGFGNWPTLDNEKLNKAQSVYFFTLVIMQWGNLLATRSRKLSIFQHKPSGNWYIFPAMICALVIGIFFSYVPFFQKTFLTRGVPVEHYFLPVAFGLGLLLLDETRKFMVRKYPNGVLAKLAWNCGSIKPTSVKLRQQLRKHRDRIDRAAFMFLQQVPVLKSIGLDITLAWLSFAMNTTTRPRKKRSWRGPPLAIKPRPRSLSLRFSQYFASAGPSRQVWLAKGLRTRRNRWIWAEVDPESFLQTIEDSTVEIRLCDNEQDGYDSDESDYLSVIMSEEDEGQSVQTNMTSLLHTDGTSFFTGRVESSQSSTSNLSCLQTPTLSPAVIAQGLIDDAVHIYHSTTDFPTAITKLEHAASLVPASHPDLKAQCYLHLGQLAQASYNFASDEVDMMPPQTQAQIKANRRLSTISTFGAFSPTSPSLSNARSHFRHAHKLFTQSRNRTGQLQCKQAVASIALDEQDWDSARNQILYILDAGKREGVQIDEVWCWSALALVALKQGEFDEVDTCWSKAWHAGSR